MRESTTWLEVQEKGRGQRGEATKNHGFKSILVKLWR